MFTYRAAALGCLVATAFAAAASAAPQGRKASATYGSWQVFCDASGISCAALQSLRDSAGTAVTAMVVRDPPGEAVAGMSVATPADTDMQRGLTFIIDGRQATVRTTFTCFETNCTIPIGLGKQELSDFRRGAPVSVLFYLKQAPRRPLRVPLAMGGFREAFDSLPVPSQ